MPQTVQQAKIEIQRRIRQAIRIRKMPEGIVGIAFVSPETFHYDIVQNPRRVTGAAQEVSSAMIENIVERITGCELLQRRFVNWSRPSVTA